MLEKFFLDDRRRYVRIRINGKGTIDLHVLVSHEGKPVWVPYEASATGPARMTKAEAPILDLLRSENEGGFEGIHKVA